MMTRDDSQDEPQTKLSGLDNMVPFEIVFQYGVNGSHPVSPIDLLAL